MARLQANESHFLHKSVITYFKDMLHNISTQQTFKCKLPAAGAHTDVPEDVWDYTHIMCRGCNGVAHSDIKKIVPTAIFVLKLYSTSSERLVALAIMQIAHLLCQTKKPAGD
jgi:hypothetical protein